MTSPETTTDFDQFVRLPISSRDIDCWKMTARDAIPHTRLGTVNWPMIVLSLCAHIEAGPAANLIESLEYLLSPSIAASEANRRLKMMRAAFRSTP